MKMHDLGFWTMLEAVALQILVQQISPRSKRPFGTHYVNDSLPLDRLAAEAASQSIDSLLAQSIHRWTARSLGRSSARTPIGRSLNRVHADHSTARSPIASSLNQSNVDRSSARSLDHSLHRSIASSFDRAFFRSLAASLGRTSVRSIARSPVRSLA